MEFLFVFILLLAGWPSFNTSEPIKCLGNMTYNASLQRCVDTKEIECDKGYHYNRTVAKCIDIDECITASYSCPVYERCQNTIGSYDCIPKEDCGQGYDYIIANKSCVDINECVRFPQYCDSTMVCENVPGSFYCREPCPPDRPHYYNYRCHICHDGYIFNMTSKSCVDIDECLNPNLLTCQPFKERCVKKPGLSICETHCTGGTLLVNGTCIDIDECSNNAQICKVNEYCENTFGTYECHEIRCGENERFNIESRKCECMAGFRWNRIYKRCEEANECDDLLPVCGTNGQCQNTFGGYKCNCFKGYEHRNGTCKDIDECQLIPGICGNLECINIPGSFNCSCPQGYKKMMDGTCEDINECIEQTGACDSSVFGGDFQCFNLIGTFRCIRSECPPGYRQVYASSDTRICHLNNRQCSSYPIEGCLQQMAEKRITKVIQIRNSGATNMHSIGTIQLTNGGFDFSVTTITAKMVLNSKVNSETDISREIKMYRSRKWDKLFVYIAKRLPVDSRITVHIQIKSNHRSQEKIYSLHQFYVFVTEAGFW